MKNDKELFEKIRHTAKNGLDKVSEAPDNVNKVELQEIMRGMTVSLMLIKSMAEARIAAYGENA